MPEIRIDVYSDTHGTPKNLKDVETSLDKMEKGAGVADKTMGGLWKQFAIGQIAVQALHKAYAIFKDLVVDSIKAAIDEEKSQHSLQAALEISGRTVRGNLEHYLNFARAQHQVTLYKHEEIEATQALLLTMGHLNQEGVDRATKGIMGLATVMDKDLHAASILVMRAMEGNYMGLSRYGIKVKETMTDEEKRNYVLDRLEVLYGRSRKEVETLGGSLGQLKKSWHEVLETIGKVITQNETVRETVVKLREETDKLADSPGFKLWLDTLVKTTVKVAGAAAYAGKEIGKGILYSIDDIFRVTEAEKLLTEANIKLGIATARAAAAGHDYKARMDALTAAAKAAAPAINETGDAQDKLTGQIKETLVPMDRGKLASEALQLSLQILGLTSLRLGESLVPAVRNLDRLAVLAANVGLKLGETFVPAVRNLDRLAAAMGHISPAWKKHLEDMKNKTQETMSKIFGAISGVMSQIDAIYQQSANNRMLALDKEYQKRLDLIKSSLMSEEEKNAAIEGLDAEYNMKRRGVQRKAAEEGKLIAIFNATISVAEGIVKALSAAPPPWNIILAAITGALGAIQIGLIRAQPIPLAAGAIFKKPVFSRDYVAGDAGPEAVIPLSELPRLMREIGGGGDRGYQSERPIITQVHIFLDSREMKKFTIKTVREGGQHGFLGKVGKEFA